MQVTEEVSHRRVQVTEEIGLREEADHRSRSKKKVPVIETRCRITKEGVGHRSKGRP